VYSHDDMSTLFRRDSMATKTARNFFSLVAKSYLRRHILPFVAYISCDVSKGNCYEVDPSKLEPNSDISNNAGRLLTAARMFLTVILDSCDNLPMYKRKNIFLQLGCSREDSSEKFKPDRGIILSSLCVSCCPFSFPVRLACKTA